MATPKYATLINDNGKKAVVLVDSPEAKDLMGQGYKLQTSAGGQSSSSLEGNAQMYATLNGGNQGNPYIAYLQPRVVTGPDGKQYLRVPKNQTLMDLADFFDKHQNQSLGQMIDLAKLQNETLKTTYDVNKPYYAPAKTKSTTTQQSTDPNAPTYKAPSVKIAKTANGGMLFLAKQKDGTYKPITAAEYSQISGQSITDLLANSTDPNDRTILDTVSQLEQSVGSGQLSVEDAAKQLEQRWPYVFGSSS